MKNQIENSTNKVNGHWVHIGLGVCFCKVEGYKLLDLGFRFVLA